jgi:excinuclease ABC subunit A
MCDDDAPGVEAGTLRVLLALNAAMFAVEVVAGWMAQSTGLLADSLDMPIAEAAGFFKAISKLRPLLDTLVELGLGYVRLGQAANTLSGGEAQRLKLAVELAKPQAPHTLYLFDEPTTGLHFGDVDKLLAAFFRLRDAGHSVLVVEHHLDVIAASDWVIDLGPGGGVNGGTLVGEGTPRKLAENPGSPTGQALTAHFLRLSKDKP